MGSYIVICIGMPGYGWCGPRLGFTDFPRYFVRYVSKNVAKMATERVAELVEWLKRSKSGDVQITTAGKNVLEGD